MLRVTENQDGRVDRFKARLVAKRFSLKFGLDYEETSAPVAKFTLAPVFLNMVAKYGMMLHQMSVETAFLSGSLNEDIDMDQPNGYLDTNQPNYACELKRSLYGLKQSPRMWNQTIDGLMIKMTFKKCELDHCIYVERDDQDMILVVLYVDGLIFASNKNELLKLSKMELSTCFKMTDLVELDYFLEMKIKNDRGDGRVIVQQTKFLKLVFIKFETHNNNPVKTPQDPSLKLTKNIRD